MPQTPHVERHFTGSKTVRDIVIGMSDGLTVPFALAAGLSGSVNATRIIVMAGPEAERAAIRRAPSSRWGLGSGLQGPNGTEERFHLTELIICITVL